MASAIIERWTPDDERPDLLSVEISWQPDHQVPALVIDVPRFFSDALD